jgi:hypothetical protein
MVSVNRPIPSEEHPMTVSTLPPDSVPDLSVRPRHRRRTVIGTVALASTVVLAAAGVVLIGSAEGTDRVAPGATETESDPGLRVILGSSYPVDAVPATAPVEPAPRLHPYVIDRR